MHKVSGAILTCGEEKRIGICLKSLSKYCDEIVVLDGAHDRTAEIASAFGANVYQFPQDERVGEYGNDSVGGGTFFEPYRREILLGLCRYDWVLVTDADELWDFPDFFFRDFDKPMAMPRYNLLNADTYIHTNTNPWYPDWVLRYMPRTTKYPKVQIHGGAQVRECAYGVEFHNYHYKRVSNAPVSPNTDTWITKQIEHVRRPEGHEEMLVSFGVN